MLYDLKNDPYEETNLLDSTDPEAMAARKRLEAVIATCPEQDRFPRLAPQPPQPWDSKPKAGAKQQK